MKRFGLLMLVPVFLVPAGCGGSSAGEPVKVNRKFMDRTGGAEGSEPPKKGDKKVGDLSKPGSKS
jgi:hypothetical protein